MGVRLDAARVLRNFGMNRPLLRQIADSTVTQGNATDNAGRFCTPRSKARYFRHAPAKPAPQTRFNRKFGLTAALTDTQLWPASPLPRRRSHRITTIVGRASTAWED